VNKPEKRTGDDATEAKMSARKDGGKGTTLAKRLGLALLSALFVLPSDPFAVSAAAQVLGAAEGAANAAIHAPIAPAAPALAGSAAPFSLPATLAAPLSAGALSAGPVALSAPAADAARSPWNPAAPTVLRAADSAALIPSAAPQSPVAGGSGLSGVQASGLPGAAAVGGSGTEAAAAPKAATQGRHAGAAGAAVDAAQAGADLDRVFDGSEQTAAAAPVEPDLGWAQLPAVPAEAPSSLAEVSLDVPAGAKYTPSPKDWRREIIYSVMLDRFGRAEPHQGWGDPAAANTRHGGNIRGAIERLDYLQRMGVTALLVNPLYFTLPAAYHNYWPLHFMAVDPHIGTMADFKELVAEAHKRGMRVVLDMVFNHTGPVLDYDEGFQFGSETKHVKDVKYAIKPVELADASNFHRRGSIENWDDPEQVKYGDFPGGLNHLATDRPQTQDILLKISKWWMKETDVDGFRLDTYMHVAPTFWTRFFQETREYAKKLGKDDFLVLGEIYHGDANVLKPELVDSRLGAAFNYPSYFGDIDAIHGRAPTGALQRRFEEVSGILGSAVHKLVNFVDNQDKPRFLDDSTPAEALRVALAFVLFSVGIPFVYYGSEQAFRRGQSNVDAGLDAYREDMFPGGQFRSLNSTGDDFDPSSPMYKYMAALADVRKRHPALSEGEQYVRWSDAHGPGLYAFSRIHDGEEVVVVLNTAAEQRSADMWIDAGLSAPGTRFVDELDGAFEASAYAPAEGGAKLSVRVPAHGVRVLVLVRRAADAPR
jgi:glycosidase